MQVQQIINTHPHAGGDFNEMRIHCIEACIECAQVCISCADACLGEEAVEQLRQCVRLNQDCADICRATGAVMSRLTGHNEETLVTLLEACALACRTCGEECADHAPHHPHCEICAQACNRCERLCDEAIRGLTTTA